ncbi:unnamed protein product [Staurois parvus]|uniref:Uncharacterized protein n=1 Tax=Staurois parvus TaxID=386267 RepID=A0ABN9GUQ5_9NEOB|nr:unnamed protein product [Staurois parvus]
MKVILLFALFGVSFCQDSKCTVEPLSEPNDGNCLAQAVKELGTFYQAFVDMCCAAAAKGTMTDDDIRATAKQFVITLNCLGCQIGRYFGEEETFQTLIDKIGDKGTDIIIFFFYFCCFREFLD